MRIEVRVKLPLDKQWLDCEVQRGIMVAGCSMKQSPTRALERGLELKLGA
jgi:hypothetical protein